MQVVVFTIDDGKFAIDSERVKGIKSVAEMAEHSQKDGCLNGTVKHGKSRIPTFDINRMLNIKSTDDRKGNTLICDMKDREVAFFVDDVRAVIKIEANQLMDSDPYEENPFVKGILRKNDTTISVLDVDKLFDFSV